MAYTEEQLAYRRDYYAKNKDRIGARRQAWRKKNAAREVERVRAWTYKTKYGITVEEYDTMLATQGGVCAICGKEPGKQLFDVDHDHDTGKVRGLLHNTCNRALGLMKDSSAIAEAAATYLKKFGK